ncbi:hypothetical protein [Polynucleobacter sp. AP-Reno-20A-A9]|uniref:hypothetical protein n=1 Tax=Polynucleobacter sp. AP-Reno-20A-A9 TaxID=2576925 RepID=UPI001C0C4283|nr:hypothetical protein [Polynucleobacter sp. AP-Reno-20A-A9]MBU3627998.1 hypothetical protein [Polynucleobacter sp. AP-Reno-20A-A9]
MTRISSYKYYECPRCGQGHIQPIYDLIDLRGPVPKIQMPVDMVVCQRCSIRMPLSEFLHIGIKDNPRRNYGAWKSFVSLATGVKPEPRPMDLYPFLSDKPFDPVIEEDAFKRFGMKPEQYPAWFKSLQTIGNLK